MAYRNSRGEMQYTLKEKYAYHKGCANSGKTPDGIKLSQTQRVNHALAANRCNRKLGKFINSLNVAKKVNEWE